MFGISARLPLRQDSRDGGYALTKTYKENIAQNMKNLLLTIPGERIMDPNFGVGLKEYLFELNVPSTHQQISQDIHAQVKIYLPFVSVEAVNFLTTANQSLAVASFIAPQEEHRLNMEVVYRILPLDIIDALIVRVDLT